MRSEAEGYINSRQGDRVAKRAALVASGIRMDGHCQITFTAKK